MQSLENSLDKQFLRHGECMTSTHVRVPKCGPPKIWDLNHPAWRQKTIGKHFMYTIRNSYGRMSVCICGD